MKTDAFLSKTWLGKMGCEDWDWVREVSGCVAFELDGEGRVNLEDVLGVWGANAECMVYNRFELGEARRLGFGVGADYWFEAYLNGEKVWSTLEMGGNGSMAFSVEDHTFVGEGRKGENLLSIRVRRGSGNRWMLAVGEKAAEEADPFRRVTVVVDAEALGGAIKPMNAVNNGPIPERHTQSISNMRAWQEAKIPYARIHDASFYAGYGGEHTVDVHMIFPDFEKDPEDPASYVFVPTDRYLSAIQAGGTKVFYRLGSKIEHGVYKCGTRVPPDFKKWAVICEHIIRHYTEGWANGFQWDIAYWEIWNEPDLGLHSEVKPTWQGTEEQFCELYRVTALHLKRCFPKLKIGGPASYLVAWTRGGFWDHFLTKMVEGERVPIDFFSWHHYTTSAGSFAEAARVARAILDEYGYTETESILNEWNYVKRFDGPEWPESLKTEVSMKGAAFVAAVMSVGQRAPVDMLMYYDARPCGMNGLFQQTFLTPLKGYYALKAWSKLVELGRELPVDTQGEKDLFATAATDGSGRVGLLLTRYSEYEQLNHEREVAIAMRGVSLWGAKVYLLDEEHDLEEIPYWTGTDGTLRLHVKLNTVVYVEVPHDARHDARATQEGNSAL